MKIHKTHIWLFIFVLSGAFVLGGTSASAEIVGVCTQDQKDKGTCLEIKNNLDEIVYIVKAVRLNGSTPVDDANPGVNWPTAGAYTYWGGPASVDDYPPYKKPSAWSYIVFDLASLPDDADPPGAQLPLDSFSCGDETISPDRFAYKLNPSVNFRSDSIFTLYYPTDKPYDACSGDKAYVLFGKECSGGLISPPEIPRVELRRFECSTSVAVVVRYDKCTGVPFDTVAYELDGEIVNDSVPYLTNPYIHAELGVEDIENPGPTYRNFPVENMGPEAGTVLCTDSDPVFLWGDRGYFCEVP